MYIYYIMTNPKGEFPYRGVELMSIQDALGGSTKHHFIKTSIFNEKVQKREKNWVFIYNQTNLLVLHSLRPFILGELVHMTLLQAQIIRNYNCITKFTKNIHLSSNSILIQNNNKMEFMFIFNEMKIGKKYKVYKPYLAFLQSEAPYDLLRITEMPLNFNMTKQFKNPYNAFYSGLSVLNRHDLTALQHDIIILSGGINDKYQFKLEIPLVQLLQLNTSKCLNMETKYLQSTSRAFYNDFKVHSINWLVDIPIILLCVLLIQFIPILYRYSRQHSHYKLYKMV
eukprot:NODE_984_length_2791_cov_0.439822.p2 type:complete len:283 gc:universal NODE_984_length_2791_cov_0.439822:2631-1783(-)